MGTISFCKYNQETVESIYSWCEDNNIPNPTGKSKIHTSIIWSRSDIPTDKWIARDASHFRRMTFDAVSLDLFDHFSKREQVMQKCLVIKLNAPYLVHCHNLMMKNGGTYDHFVYVPHVTVCYNFPEDLDISKLKIPEFKFHPNKIFCESFTPPTRKS